MYLAWRNWSGGLGLPDWKFISAGYDRQHGMGAVTTLFRAVLFVTIAAAGIAAAWFMFIWYPESILQLLGVVLVLLVVPLVIKAAKGSVWKVTAPYNVAEVGVTGPIVRKRSPGPFGRSPTGGTADDVVEQIEQADADRNVRALLVRLNTPGGEIVPSEDIKLAVERFDGPTIGYATDTCASGGYEIASGCDELWARSASVVGSIGVLGSRVNATELAENLGLEYEQFTAGRYKDAGVPLKEMDDEERAYLQGLTDDFYDWFVNGVSQRRDLEPEEIRKTEARVYVGEEAKEVGLVDEIGTREDVESRLQERLETSVHIREFEPHLGLGERLSVGAQRIAYAAGAGVMSHLQSDQQVELR